MDKTRISNVLNILQKNDVPELHAFIGLDGFVDEVIHVVDKRFSPDKYSRIETIKEYGERILESCGLSSNMEFVTINQKIGGNGPIYANGLRKLGVDITYIGSIGLEQMNPVFAELAVNSTMIGVAEPCVTEAMEFLDGKLICSKLDSLNQLSWEDIVRHVYVKELVHFLDSADLISFNNWTMIPHMNEIWRHLLDEVIPLMNTDLSRKHMFFDLADPRKRTEADILEALELIREFQKAGFLVQLGLNKKEAYFVGDVIQKQEDVTRSSEDLSLRELTVFLADWLEIEGVVVHPVEKAACFIGGAYYEVDGPYCEHPVLTTGAGDIFNSGFVFGQIHDLSPEESLLLGVSASGFYVRNGHGGDGEELSDFILNEEWKIGNR